MKVDVAVGLVSYSKAYGFYGRKATLNQPVIGRPPKAVEFITTADAGRN